MSNRMKRVLNQIAEQELDGLLVVKHEALVKSNVRYISGFTGTSAYAMLSPKGLVLLTDDRYTQQASQQCPDFEIIQHERPIKGELKKVADNLGIRKLGYETAGLAVQTLDTVREALPGTDLIPTQEIIEAARAVKEPQEIECLATACRMADQLYEHILGFMKPGVQEKDLALEMDFHARKLGATGPAFDIIIASGKRGSYQHGMPSEKELEVGDFVVMDFGCLYNGYRSDMTRTVAVGAVDERQREVYSAVKQAEQKGLDLLRAGVGVKDVFSQVLQMVADAGYGQYAGRGIGHGIGLEIHEDPFIRPTSDAEFKVGNVVTMEPGIYIPDWGGVRIEDAVVIEEKGCRILTHSTKELTVV